MESASSLSILIVLTGSLGDVVRGLPLVHALRTQYSGARISWLIEDKWSEILALHPGIDRQIVFHRRRGLRGIAQVWSELRKEKFDLVLDLQRHLKSALFSRAARAKRRIGFHRRDSKEGNWLFHTERIPGYGSEIPKIRHYLHFLDYLGCAWKDPLTFGFEQCDERKLAPGFFSSPRRHYVVLVLGSSWKSKDWLAPGYSGVISRLLRETDVDVVLAGDRTQLPMASELCSAAQSDRVHSLAGQTSLIELVGVLKGAICGVGPDSGPGHISSALGVPYVTLFGPTDPRRVVPYGCEDLAVVSPVGCAPCWRRECPGLNKVCMRLISPDTVFERVQRIVSAV